MLSVITVLNKTCYYRQHNVYVVLNKFLMVAKKISNMVLYSQSNKNTDNPRFTMKSWLSFFLSKCE